MKQRIALIAGLGLLVGLGALWAPSTAAGNPLSDPSVFPEHGSFSGRVAQRFSAGSYVYLQIISTAGEARWVVTLAGAGARATDVTATLFAEAEHFHSARLGRDFAPLHFAAVSPAAR